MTILVYVKNDEPLGGKNIRVSEFDLKRETGRRELRERRIIEPQITTSFHIHLLKSIEVEENHPEYRDT